MISERIEAICVQHPGKLVPWNNSAQENNTLAETLTKVSHRIFHSRPLHPHGKFNTTCTSFFPCYVYYRQSSWFGPRICTTVTTHMTSIPSRTKMIFPTVPRRNQQSFMISLKKPKTELSSFTNLNVSRDLFTEILKCRKTLKLHQIFIYFLLIINTCFN